MNIRSIGPNIVVAPGADSGDGYFDVVLIGEADRGVLSDYLYAKLVKGAPGYPGESIRAKNIRIKAKHNLFHIDDELKELVRPVELSIRLHTSNLSFYI
jgi:hypothetical protein